MTHAEVRAKLLTKKEVPLEHGGVCYQFRIPGLDEAKRALEMKDAQVQAAFLAFRCLRFDGLPVFETPEEAGKIPLDEATVLDAIGAKFKELFAPKKDEAAASPEEVLANKAE